MGKGSGGGGTNTVVQQSSIPQYVQDAYQKAIGMANNNASTPLQQYGGSMVADFTPTQQVAFGNINGAQGAQNPFINAASQMIGQSNAPIWGGVQQFNPDTINQYMNPYNKDVVKSTMDIVNQQQQQQQQDLIGNAVSKGAWGGDRAGVAQAVLAGQQGLANNQTVANLNSQNYQQALAAFQQQQQQQIGANEANSWLASQGATGLAGLGNQAQTGALNAGMAQLQAGGLQQQQGQNILNIPYEQFQQQQAYPYQQTQFFSNIAEGIGGSSPLTSTQQSTPAAPSIGSQVAGLGLGGLGLYGAMQKGGGGSTGATAARGGRIKGGIANCGRVAEDGIAGFAYGGVPDVSRSYIPIGGQPQRGRMAQQMMRPQGSTSTTTRPDDPTLAAKNAVSTGKDLYSAYQGGSALADKASQLYGRYTMDSGVNPDSIMSGSGAVDPGFGGSSLGFGSLDSSMPAAGSVAFPGATTGTAGAGWGAYPGAVNMPDATLGAYSGPGIQSLGGEEAAASAAAEAGASDVGTAAAANAAADTGAAAATDAATTGLSGFLDGLGGGAEALGGAAIEGIADLAATIGSTIGEVGSAVLGGVEMLPLLFLKGGGRVSGGIANCGRRAPDMKFDDGGAVPTIGGLAPVAGNVNPKTQSQYNGYADLPDEKLSELSVRFGPGTPQGSLIQKALAQKSAMPNAFMGQGMADGGIPDPMTPDEVEEALPDIGADDGADDGAYYSPVPQGIALSAPAPRHGGIAAPMPAPQQVGSAPEAAVVPPASHREGADPWLALANAGFAMAASPSPYFGQAMGQGALAGIQNLGEQKKEVAQRNLKSQEIENNAKRLASEADRWHAQIQQRQTQAEQTAQYRNDMIAQRREAMARPDYAVNNVNGLMYDRHTGENKEGQVNPYGSSDPDKPQLTGEAFLQTLSPAQAAKIKATVNGDSPWPSPNSRQASARILLDQVYQYDPQASMQTAPAVKAFNLAKQGDATRFINNSAQHIQTLGHAVDALDNGDVRMFNSVAQKYALETGSPVPTNFNAVKQIVGNEVLKAVQSGVGSVADREELAHQLEVSNSPAQLKGVLHNYGDLMAAQVNSLEQQYKASTHKENYRDKYLLPQTKDYFAQFDGGSKEKSQSAGGEKSAAPSGKVLVQAPDGRRGYVDRSHLDDLIKQGGKEIK